MAPGRWPCLRSALVRRLVVPVCWLGVGLQAGASGSPQASIEGRVVTGQAEDAPVRGVAISAIDSKGVVVARVLSDDSGRFRIAELPAGEYQLVASKPGYVTSAFGSLWRGGPGAAVRVAPGETPASLTIRMTRGAVLAGVVREIDGRGAADRRVTALRVRTDQSLVEASAAMTDPSGAYRLFGLPPGEYVIAVAPLQAVRMGRPLEVMTVDAYDAILAALESGRPVEATAVAPRSTTLAPVYLPGTPDVAQSRRVTVASGDEIAGLDVTWTDTPSVRVSGVVAGMPSAGATPTVTLRREGLRLPVSLSGAGAFTRADRSGTFAFDGVPPGRYLVEAIVTEDEPGATPRVSWARANLDIGSQDVSGIALSLQPAIEVPGRLEGMPRRAGRGEAPGATIRLVPADGAAEAGTRSRGGLLATMSADGTFVIPQVVPGSYELDVTAADVLVTHATVGGVDVLGQPFELGPAAPGEIVVTVTDRPARLTGSLSLPETHSPASYQIVLLPTRSVARRSTFGLRTAVLGGNGRFVLEGLPPGEYLVGAASSFVPDNLLDPEFFAAFRSAALPVRLEPGENRQIELAVGR